MTELNALRKQLRKQRRSVSCFQQRQTELQVIKHLRHHVAFQTSKKIGIYLDAFGEVRTTKIIRLCFQLKKHVYLPMICNMNQHLVWVKISKNQFENQRFSHHPLGMKEPMKSRGSHISHLDCLIMPLLAIDGYGTRLGMGGGYYDRTLGSAFAQPRRIGLAHNFQYLNLKLHRQAWDQPLDVLITPSKTYQFRRNYF